MWGAYKQQKFISHSPGGWKSEIRVPALLGSGEGPVPVGRLLTFHCVLKSCKGARDLSGISFIKELILLIRVVPS